MARYKFYIVLYICGENVKLKIILVISQTYSYVYTNFRPFIWTLAWIIVSLLVRPLKFEHFNLVYYECHDFFVKNN